MNEPEPPLASDSHFPAPLPGPQSEPDAAGELCADATSDSADGSGFVFSGTRILSPVDELEQVVDRKRRALEGRDTSAQVARLGRAHELARHQLEEALASSDGVAPPGGGDVTPC